MADYASFVAPPGSSPPGWPATFVEARLLQDELAGQVVTQGDVPRLRRIAGIDVHYSERDGLAWGAIAVLDAATLDLEESVLAAVPVGFPYVPGYLSFRETPAALAALAMLKEPPDILLVDGQGYAHPRRFGIACHIGVLTGIPAIGVAKSRLCGSYREPDPAFGSSSPLVHRKEVIGTVLRSRAAVSPLFVSAGHRIGLEQAAGLVLGLTRGRRLPEPTRIADLISRLHPG